MYFLSYQRNVFYNTVTIKYWIVKLTETLKHLSSKLLPITLGYHTVYLRDALVRSPTKSQLSFFADQSKLCCGVSNDTRLTSRSSLAPVPAAPPLPLLPPLLRLPFGPGGSLTSSAGTTRGRSHPLRCGSSESIKTVTWQLKMRPLRGRIRAAATVAAACRSSQRWRPEFD